MNSGLVVLLIKGQAHNQAEKIQESLRGGGHIFRALL
jgi:hypothetical protein